MLSFIDFSLFLYSLFYLFLLQSLPFLFVLLAFSLVCSFSSSFRYKVKLLFWIFLFQSKWLEVLILFYLAFLYPINLGMLCLCFNLSHGIFLIFRVISSLTHWLLKSVSLISTYFWIFQFLLCYWCLVSFLVIRKILCMISAPKTNQDFVLWPKNTVAAGECVHVHLRKLLYSTLLGGVFWLICGGVQALYFLFDLSAYFIHYRKCYWCFLLLLQLSLLLSSALLMFAHICFGTWCLVHMCFYHMVFFSKWTLLHDVMSFFVSCNCFWPKVYFAWWFCG